MNTVIPGLEIFMSAVNGHDHIDGMAALAHIETPLMSLDSLDGRGLGNFPPVAVGTDSADVTDSFMGTGSVRFVDASDAMTCCHRLFLVEV
jgi:hypothetical protein